MLSIHPKPLILLASSESWLIQQLRDALIIGAFRVTVAHTERETVEQAQTENPHGIIVDAGIAPPGYGLCTTLRTIALGTPIVLTRAGEITRAVQLEALRAGVWAVRSSPIDTEELMLRLAVYVEPKLELQRLGAECMVDQISGLYNPVGLARRADELAALATRQGLALACIVFRPQRPLPNQAASDRLALSFRTVGRRSDAVGRTSHAEFAVFAPATNTFAAERLVRRMTDAVALEFGYLPERGGRVAIRAGVSATQATHKISPPTLLARARANLEGLGAGS